MPAIASRGVQVALGIISIIAAIFFLFSAVAGQAHVLHE